MVTDSFLIDSMVRCEISEEHALNFQRFHHSEVKIYTYGHKYLRLVQHTLWEISSSRLIPYVLKNVFKNLVEPNLTWAIQTPNELL